MKIEVEGSTETIAQNMTIGQLGVNDYGEYILRTYGGWVSLNDPTNTWTEDNGGWIFEMKVKILPKGTVIKMTI